MRRLRCLWWRRCCLHRLRMTPPTPWGCRDGASAVVAAASAAAVSPAAAWPLRPCPEPAPGSISPPGPEDSPRRPAKKIEQTERSNLELFFCSSRPQQQPQTESVRSPFYSSPPLIQPLLFCPADHISLYERGSRPSYRARPDLLICAGMPLFILFLFFLPHTSHHFQTGRPMQYRYM